MKTSEKVGSLMEAFAKAQGEFKNPVRNAEVKYGNTEFSYADLAACLDAVRPALTANGIALTQTVYIADDAQVLVTRLSLGEEWMSTEYPLGPVSADHKDIGAAYTYGRRYSLVSITGLAPDEDTDAKDIKTKAKGPKNSQAAKPDTKAVKWKNAQAMNLNGMNEPGELDNWEVTQEALRKELKEKEPALSEDLEDLIANTRKRVGKTKDADFDGSTD